MLVLGELAKTFFSADTNSKNHRKLQGRQQKCNDRTSSKLKNSVLELKYATVWP